MMQTGHFDHTVERFQISLYECQFNILHFLNNTSVIILMIGTVHKKKLPDKKIELHIFHELLCIR